MGDGLDGIALGFRYHCVRFTLGFILTGRECDGDETARRGCAGLSPSKSPACDSKVLAAEVA